VSAPDSEPRGIRASFRRVIRHAGSLTELQKELARTEMKRKMAALGAGAGLAIGAGVILFFAVAFGLATAAAALALVVDWWLALLIMFVLLLLVTAVLGLMAVRMIKKGTPPVPEQAIEELRLTRQTLRGGHAR
jgi:membrane protein implicated in regulation of membrane protease activity